MLKRRASSTNAPDVEKADKGTAAIKLPIIEEFSCYQCHSDDFFDKTCDEDVRYLKPVPCAYLYGSRPTSCYILIHRGWRSLERGCGSELDKYTYATCDTDLFAECKICATSGCNGQDMTEVLAAKKNQTAKATPKPNGDGGGSEPPGTEQPGTKQPTART